MNKNVLKELNKIKQGGKIRAELEHCNPDLYLENQIINICKGEGCWYLLDIDLKPTHNKLSYNWNIVDFRKLK